MNVNNSRARWQALDALMTEMSTKYKGSDDPQVKVLGHFTDRLQAFGAGQYSFFLDGQGGQYKLKEEADYPLEYARAVTLDQVSTDLEVIQRAADQRLTGSEPVKKRLREADDLARAALEPAEQAGWLSKKTIAVTYFQKSPFIRLIPYAPVALIGIPFTALQLDQDLFAIAHDAGHYVYRYGAKGLKRVYQLFSENLRKKEIKGEVKQWAEEIFADAYGCLIAGQEIAKDFQELSYGRPWSEFVNGDGEHPIPAIRPKIYSHMLSKSGLTEQAKALDDGWDEMRESRKSPTEPTADASDVERDMALRITESPEESKDVSFAHADGLVDDMLRAVDAFLELSDLGVKVTKPAIQSFTVKLEALPKVTPVTDVQRDVVSARLPESRPNSIVGDPWRDWLYKANPLGKHGQSTDVPMRSRRGGWMNVLLADGWTFEGPQQPPWKG